MVAKTYTRYSSIYKYEKEFIKSENHLRKALSCFEEIDAKKYIEKNK